MNRDELQAALRERKINPLAYSLDGGLPNEKYTLEHAGSQWSVYYSERGQKTGERTFDSEDEACRHFLSLLGSDPSAQSV